MKSRITVLSLVLTSILARDLGRVVRIGRERVDAVDVTLVETYAAVHDPVADVAGAFENDNPVDAAAHVCAWTWFCPIGDVHANTAGYGVIAESFLDALP